MEKERAQFVPKGSGGYYCTIEIEMVVPAEKDVPAGCVIRLINTSMEDFTFLMAHEKWPPFKVDGVMVSVEGKTAKFMKDGVTLNYAEAVKFMETRSRFKRI